MRSTLKYRFLFLLLFFILRFSVSSIGQTGWQWVKRPIPTAVEAYLCATDKWGGVYGGANDIITKYDTSGNFLWLSIISQAIPIAINADDFGNLYELGAFTSASITVGSYTLNNSHSADCQFFIVKYDTAGNIKWGKNIGNVVAAITGFSYFNGIVTDNVGNIYVTCPFSNNPILGSYSFTNHDTTDSTNDILVAKLDSAGDVIWAKSYGGKKNESPAGLVLTSSNHLYISGWFNSDSLLFGATTLVDTNSYVYGNNIFVARFNSTGNPIWAKKEYGTSPSVITNGLAADDSENIFISGYFATGTITFGAYTFLPPALWYMSYGFLTKYDSLGNVSWAKETKNCFPRSIVVDSCNNIWMIGGMYAGNDTLDGHIIHTPPISTDPVFIAGWNSSGTYNESTSLGSGSDDQIGIALDSKGHIYICGDYNIDTFHVGSDTLRGGTSSGEEYMFIARYNTGVNYKECGSLSVRSQSVPNETIKIYPNPTTTSLTIQSTNQPINQISITNLPGQTIYTHEYNSEKVEVDVATLPAGMYLIKINNTEVRKFVKQ
jgi:Secretion system C-terminal sorting domain